MISVPSYNFLLNSEIPLISKEQVVGAQFPWLELLAPFSDLLCLVPCGAAKLSPGDQKMLELLSLLSSELSRLLVAQQPLADKLPRIHTPSEASPESHFLA